MRDLIASVFNDKDRARQVRQEFAKMQREHLVDLEDTVVAYKDSKGKVKLDQTVNLTTAGAASGGFWGLLIGMIFSLPFGGYLLPIITGVFGCGVGALSGALADYGIDDKMMKELSSDLDHGKAALFVLVRKATIDRVLEQLEKFEGKVLRTSLSHELEERLQEVLEKASHAETAA